MNEDRTRNDPQFSRGNVFLPLIAAFKYQDLQEKKRNLSCDSDTNKHKPTIREQNDCMTYREANVAGANAAYCNLRIKVFQSSGYFACSLNEGAAC